MQIVTAALLTRGNSVLIARRKVGQKQEGQWEFPGGKLEQDEKLAACLQREIREELCVEIRVGEVFATSDYHYEHGTIHLVAMKAEIVSGTLRPTVHDELRWVPVEELLHYPLSPADIPIAQKLNPESVTAGTLMYAHRFR